MPKAPKQQTPVFNRLLDKDPEAEIIRQLSSGERNDPDSDEDEGAD